LVITFEPETLGSRLEAQMAWTLAWFVLKTSAKCFILVVEAQCLRTSAKKLKSIPLIGSPTKDPKPKA